MSLVIGLTGGIASGKSTVSSMLKQMGFTVIDADIEARLAVEKGTEAYEEIVRHFGEDILNETEEIDRAKLGSIIFQEEEQRLKLNSIVHPAVRQQMLQKKEAAIQKGESLIILDIPLLFESKLEYLADQTLLIYVDEQTQLARLMARNKLTEDEAIARIRSQLPLADKKKLADDIIYNNGTIEETQHQLLSLLKKWE
ncbi:dephospho-CoA kinase [Cytobacillus gottheilii]|uniref:Dephospho-CoA kinase n=1 Tax=Cytobacillus gottheilii TaxID=859144 RepID=A0ABX8F9G5_9BACI|nr:dephospho-CoA kinase [Cytobacillus gottheilii]QVY60639.1 dephospho-CoA kinase [Cytobacillus gottheilii]